MLQVTRRVLSLTRDEGLEANRRPCQRVMIIAGRRSCELTSHQERGLREDAVPRDASENQT